MAKIALSLFTALFVCRSSKPAREQLHRSEREPDLTAGDGGLKVFGEATVAAEPSEGSFDHLAARQDTRASTIGPLDAACALRRGLKVVTYNAREFARIGGLGLEDWHGRQSPGPATVFGCQPNFPKNPTRTELPR